MDDFPGFYQSHIKRYEQAIATTRKKLFYNAVFRLASFAAFLLFVYLFIGRQENLLAALALVSLATFLWFVKRSTDLNNIKKLDEDLLFINTNEAGIVDGHKNKFYNGENERSPNEYYEDLDIFGEGSLFQLINRTVTRHGKEALTLLFKHPLIEQQAIADQQSAIQTLAPQNSERQMIVAAALANKDNKETLDNLHGWLNQAPVYSNNRWLQIARYAVPLLNLLALIAWLFFDKSYPLTLSILISWLHVGYISKYTNQQNIVLGKKHDLLNSYAAVLREFNKVNAGTSSSLVKLKQQTANANAELKKLSGLVNLLDQRLNLFANILLNSFLVYDLQCILGLEKWKLTNRHHLAEWISCVGQIECFTSLATYAFNHPENAYPSIEKEGLLIEGKGVYHPLIPAGMNVSNDISLGKTSKLLLITGSNMSGKTTYLRTVGH